jgi:FixJ family two-component response regulator
MEMGHVGKVLLAEDDDSMREAIAALLDAAGIASTGYASAEALLAGGAVDEARCVISDIRLPVMSGLDLLALLRSRVAAPPVIMITGHDAPNLRRDAQRLGASAYLTKPFEGNTLLAAIEMAAGASPSN